MVPFKGFKTHALPEPQSTMVSIVDEGAESRQSRCSCHRREITDHVLRVAHALPSPLMVLRDGEPTDQECPEPDTSLAVIRKGDRLLRDGCVADDFAATVVDVVLEFDPTFHIGRMEVRPSAKGNYTGLTVMVRATSRAQLDDLYRALSSHPMVKIVM